jgi:hypothetical protein
MDRRVRGFDAGRASAVWATERTDDDLPAAFSGQVVVGIGDRADRAALSWAASEAHHTRRRLHLVHVWSPFACGPAALGVIAAVGGSPPLTPWPERAQGLQRLLAAADWLAQRFTDIDTDVSVIDGDVGSTLSEVGERAHRLVLGPTARARHGGRVGALYTHLVASGRVPVVRVLPAVGACVESRQVVMIATDIDECERLLPAALARAARGYRLHIVVCPSGRRCDERWTVATESVLFDLLTETRRQHGIATISAHVASLDDTTSRVVLANAEMVMLGVHRSRAVSAPRRQAHWRERLRLIATTTAVVPAP